jgi:2-polyprenyl-6-methoxyphenol hydroxylase-like FAD-dependent oxidoreductase
LRDSNKGNVEIKYDQKKEIMNIIKNKKIAIVGGGPGGLTLARLLQMSGADINVYERDLNKDARAQGATLDLHEESGLAALTAAGLMEAFNANYRPGADKLHIVDKHATLLWSDEEDTQTERGRPEIDRGPLQKILLESLQPGTVVWNNQFVALTQQNCWWQLEFKNSPPAVADIVIAADGANSRLRPYITPIKSFYSGYTAVEGAVYHSEMASPRVHQLLKGGKIFAMGDEKTLIVSSKGDGSLMFYPCFKADEQWHRECGIDFFDKAQVLAWFKTAFTGWDDIWLEPFENASPPFMPRPLYCMPLDQTWEPTPNLTMLGDAAHLMPPYAGEGVNMAMQDALELSKCLTNPDYPDTLAAITAFEKQMRIRASEAAKQSLESLVALHSPEAVSFMLGLIS